MEKLKKIRRTDYRYKFKYLFSFDELIDKIDSKMKKNKGNKKLFNKQFSIKIVVSLIAWIGLLLVFVISSNWFIGIVFYLAFLYVIYLFPSHLWKIINKLKYWVRDAWIVNYLYEEKTQEYTHKHIMYDEWFDKIWNFKEWYAIVEKRTGILNKLRYNVIDDLGHIMWYWVDYEETAILLQKKLISK